MRSHCCTLNPSHPSLPHNRFDVRLMQTGRMKGQAFVGLPSEEAAVKALRETNGYQLAGRPMVVVSQPHPLHISPTSHHPLSPTVSPLPSFPTLSPPAFCQDSQSQARINS